MSYKNFLYIYIYKVLVTYLIILQPISTYCLTYNFSAFPIQKLSKAEAQQDAFTEKIGDLEIKMSTAFVPNASNPSESVPVTGNQIPTSKYILAT